jgi:hypothetical protein
MAAGGSTPSLKRRGATTGQGAKVRREGQAPSPSLGVYVPAIDSLEEISGWLGTFRERLRMARADEFPQVVAVVQELEARFETRRAELA